MFDNRKLENATKEQLVSHEAYALSHDELKVLRATVTEGLKEEPDGATMRDFDSNLLRNMVKSERLYAEMFESVLWAVSESYKDRINDLIKMSLRLALKYMSVLEGRK